MIGEEMVTSGAIEAHVLTIVNRLRAEYAPPLAMLSRLPAGHPGHAMDCPLKRALPFYPRPVDDSFKLGRYFRLSAPEVFDLKAFIRLFDRGLLPHLIEADRPRSRGLAEKVGFLVGHSHVVCGAPQAVDGPKPAANAPHLSFHLHA